MIRINNINFISSIIISNWARIIVQSDTLQIIASLALYGVFRLYYDLYPEKCNSENVFKSSVINGFFTSMKFLFKHYKIRSKNQTLHIGNYCMENWIYFYHDLFSFRIARIFRHYACYSSLQINRQEKI